MSQENTSATPSLVCDDGVTATGSSKDNTVWLDKICTELVYHNLAFLAKYKTSQTARLILQAPRAVSDAVDGCIGVTGHKIIKSVVGIVLEHLVDRHLKKNCYAARSIILRKRNIPVSTRPLHTIFSDISEELRGKVCKPSLKLILARTLKLFGLSPHLQRIQVLSMLFCASSEMRCS